MTQLVRQILPLPLVILLTVWLVQPLQASDITVAIATRPTAAVFGYNQAIPCLSLVPIGCQPNLALVIRQWASLHGLRWDQTQWGLPVYVEVDPMGGWQRISVLCLHITRAEP